MAGSLELLGQNKTLQDKIQAHFNVANQALAGGLEQNQELLINTQQTFSQSIDAQAQVTSPQAQATARNNSAVSNLLSGIADRRTTYAEYDQNKQLQNYQLELEPRKAEDEKAARQAELNLKAAKEKQEQVSAQEFDESVQQVLKIQEFNIPSQDLTKEQAEPEKTLRLKLKAAQQQRESFTQKANRVNQDRQQQVLSIQNPLNQSQGQPAQTFDPLLTMNASIGNANTGGAKRPKVVLPFAAGAKNIRFADRDYHEPNHSGHTHARVDVAADSGTPIQGTVLEQVGITGHLSGGHLNWKIPKRNTASASDTIDSVEYFAGLNTTSSIAHKALGNTNSWQSDYNTVKTQEISPKIPNIGNILYTINGNVENQNQLSYADSTQQMFNFQVPAKKGYVANVAYPEDNIDNTHGYAYLHKNVAFRRAINTTANKLGIPGSWIADIIAVETSFNPREFHKTNSCGYGGLIGFGTDDAQEFGTTLRHILSLPPERQMVYVEKYLSRPKIKRHLNKGVEYVAAAVFGGRGLLNKLIKNPSKALRTSDGAINLQTYMQRLGRDVGRRYDFQTNRQTKPSIFTSSQDLQSRVRVLSLDAAN